MVEGIVVLNWGKKTRRKLEKEQWSERSEKRDL